MYRILVVDDEEKMRVLIRKYAEYEGYEVEEAADGMSAIELCRQEKFDLMILDIMMPELDGFSACREIRKFSQIPVLMLSARGEEYDRIHGFELGIDDYVTKPFSPKELMLRVQAIIKRGTILYEKIAGFTDTFLGIGDRLASLQRDYDKAFNQLSDGNGSVVRQAEMLKGMSLTPKKRISPRLLPKDTIQEETEEENDNIQ